MAKRIGQIHDPVLEISADATRATKLVYVLCSNKPIIYGSADLRSRIVYIGMSRNGLDRLAESAAKKIVQAFDEIPGLKRLDGYVVWPESRRGRPLGDKTPHLMLESAFLLFFKEYFGVLPRLNKNGAGASREDAFAAFSYQRVRNIVFQYS